jgi:hypothetical protein
MSAVRQNITAAGVGAVAEVWWIGRMPGRLTVASVQVPRVLRGMRRTRPSFYDVRFDIKG